MCCTCALVSFLPSRKSITINRKARRPLPSNPRLYFKSFCELDSTKVDKLLLADSTSVRILATNLMKEQLFKARGVQPTLHLAGDVSVNAGTPLTRQGGFAYKMYGV